MKPGRDYIGIGVFALIFNQRGEELLVRSIATEKKSKDYEEVWSMPGGTVEYGEKCVAALRREITEETGLYIKDEQFLNYNDYIKEGKHWIAINFFAKTDDLTLSNLEPDKQKELRWFAKDKIPKNISPYTKRCLEDIENKKLIY